MHTMITCWARKAEILKAEQGERLSKKITRFAMAEKLSAWVVQQVIESPLPICFLFFKLFGGGMDYKTGIWMLQRLLVRLVTAWGRAFAGFLIWWCWWWVLYAIPAISGKMQRTLRGLRGRNNCIGRQYWFKLRRDLEAVSGWGVKGLLWQQMERPAARSMLINRRTVVCRLSRSAANTWSPGTTTWCWQVLHNAPWSRQKCAADLLLLPQTQNYLSGGWKSTR